MKRITIIFFSVLALMISSGVYAKAATTSDVIELAERQEAYFDLYGQTDKAPVTSTGGGEERISTDDGTLSLTATDLTLPGKNGFDVNITRNYNSGELYSDEYVEPLLYSITGRQSINVRNESLKKVYQYYVEGDESKTPVFVAFNCEEDLLDKEIDGKLYLSSDYTNYIATTWGWASDFTYYAVWNEGTVNFEYGTPFYYADALPMGNDVVLVRDRTLVPRGLSIYTIRSYIYKQYEQIEKLSIGNGWSYNNLSMRGTSKTKDPVEGETEREQEQSKKYMYTYESGMLTDPETGSSLNYTFTYRDWIETGYDDNEANFQFIEGKVFGSYYENGNPYQSHMYKINLVKSKYEYDENDPYDHSIEVERYDGITFCFRQTSYRNIYLVKKIDRFGNTIKYKGRRGTDGMIDSYERTIDFEYENSKISGVIVDGVKLVSYKMIDENNDVLDPENVLNCDNLHTLEVKCGGEDIENNTVIYRGKYRNNVWLTSMELDNPGAYATLSGKTFNIEEVELPTGAKTCYIYSKQREIIPTQEHLKRDRIKVIERKEILPQTNEEVNKLTYTYDQSNLDERKAVTTKENGITYKEYFNKKGQLLKTEQTMEESIIVTSYEYEKTNEGNYLPIKITNDQYDKNMANKKTITKTMTYNKCQQLASEDDGLHKREITYGEYGLVHTEKIKQSDGNDIITENAFSTDGKYILSSSKKQNNKYLEKTVYGYNSCGEITGISQYNGVNSLGRYTHNSYEYLPFDETNPDKNILIKTITVANVSNISENGEETTKDIVTTEYYDYFGNVYKITDDEGKNTFITYDSLQRPIRYDYPDGTAETINYDQVNNIITKTDKTGITTKAKYDSLGREKEVYIKNGNGVFELVTSTEYTKYNQPSKKTVYKENNAENSRIEYTYYTDGQLKTEISYDADGKKSHKEYAYQPGYSTTQSEIKVKVYSDDNNYVTVTQLYDLYGRMVSENILGNSVNASRTLTYDDRDNLISETDYKGNLTTYTYDYKNRPVTVTDANGNTETTTYDIFDNVIAVKDKKGFTTTISYNALGLQTEYTNTLGGKTKFFYDTNGNLTKQYQQNNAEGEAESYSLTKTIYDIANRPTAVINNDGNIDNIVKYEYDIRGNLVKMITGITDINEAEDSSKHNITTYQYNSLNQLVSETDPNGNTTFNSYDKLGNLVNVVDKLGGNINYTYNGIGQLMSVNAQRDGKQENISYAYNLLGNITSMTDSTGVTNYAYNELGRLISESKNNVVKTYSYDSNGNRTNFVLTNNGIEELNTSYTYDNLNRLASLTEDGETTTYSYDANGNLTSSQGRVATWYSYNNANLLYSISSSVNNKVISNTGIITYYKDGNKQYENRGTGNLVSYEYDNMGRLTKESVDGKTSTEYSYDNFGNRINKVTSDINGNVLTSNSYRYNKNNLLVEDREITGENQIINNHIYDKMGNPVIEYTATVTGEADGYSAELSEEMNGIKRFEYDPLNRLTNISDEDNNISYTYDGNGLRQSKTVNGILTSHIYDGMNVVVDNKEGEKQVYVRGLSLISRSVNNGENEYYIFNSHGDTNSLVNSNGDILKDYTYDAFGNHESVEDNNPFRYNGEYYDNETGYIYLRARYYDANIGRFITEDPARDGINWYVYCGNNPVMFVDPTGETAETIMDIAGTVWSLKDFITNPSWINAAFLVWDVASVVVPFIPGSYITKTGKYVVKSGSKTDDVVDALKVLNKSQKIDAIKDGAIVLPYKSLKKLSKGTGLEAHHLIEKRFADVLGIKPDDILSIAIDKDMHQKITNAMRKELPYSTLFNKKKYSPQEIWNATKKVYSDLGMDDYIEPLKQMLKDSGVTGII